MISKEEFEEWQKVKRFLAMSKEREMQLRLKLVSGFNLEVGSTKVMLHGVQVKIIVKETLTIDEDAFELVYDELSVVEKKAITFKPSLNKKKYEALKEGNPLQMNCVTRKSGAPTVTVT